MKILKVTWIRVESKRSLKANCHPNWTVIQSERSLKVNCRPKLMTTLVDHVRWSFNLKWPFSFYSHSFCMTVHLEWLFTFDPNLPRWAILNGPFIKPSKISRDHSFKTRAITWFAVIIYRDYEIGFFKSDKRAIYQLPLANNV